MPEHWWQVENRAQSIWTWPLARQFGHLVATGRFFTVRSYAFWSAVGSPSGHRRRTWTHGS